MFKFTCQEPALGSFKDLRTLNRYCTSQELKLEYRTLSEAISAHCPAFNLLLEITALLKPEDDRTLNFMLHAISHPEELLSCKERYKLGFYFRHQKLLNRHARDLVEAGLIQVKQGRITYEGSLSLICDKNCSYTGYALFITDLYTLRAIEDLSSLRPSELLDRIPVLKHSPVKRGLFSRLTGLLLPEHAPLQAIASLRSSPAPEANQGGFSG